MVACNKLLLLVLLSCLQLVIGNKAPCMINFTGWTRCSSYNYDLHYGYSLPATPVAIVTHPVSVAASIGATVTFNCTVDTPEEAVVGWRFNGSGPLLNDQGQLVVPRSHWTVLGNSVLTVVNTTHSDYGYYECVVGSGLHKNNDGWVFATLAVSSRAWIRSQLSNATDMPVLSAEPRDPDHEPVLGFFKLFEEKCTSPNAPVYWLKDGVDITAYYSPSSGVLNYNESVTDNIYGVYQCCAETEAGGVCQYYRARNLGFSNPPTNLTCTAVTSPVDRRQPRLLLSWDTPVITPSNSYFYHILLKDNSWCFTANVTNCLEAIVDVDGDNSFINCSAFVRDPKHKYNSALASAGVNTELRIENAPVEKLTVTCGANLTVALPSPLIPFDSPFNTWACLNKLTVWTFCYLNNTLVEPSKNYTQDFGFFGYCGENYSENNGILAEYSLNPPAGSVCVSGGSYELLEGEGDLLRVVSPVNCTIPLPPATDCSNSTTGPCETEVAPEPTDCSNSTTGPCGTEGVLPMYSWPIIAVVLVVIILVVTVSIALLHRQRVMKIQHKKNERHFLGTIVEGQLSGDTYEEVPVNPIVLVPANSTLSLDTVVNYLYEDEGKVLDWTWLPGADSSGYGSSNDSRYITEYYEHDTSNGGYIHIVPYNNR